MAVLPTFNIEEIKTLVESVNEGSKLGTDFFTKDTEFLSGLGEVKTPELVGKITEFLVGEGRPGSAEYMDVFSKSAVLDKELKLLESGNFNAKKIEQLGLPVMIDTQKTTPEMIRAGQAVLTQEARLDFLGATNSLKFKTEQYLGKTAQKAADYYSTELAKNSIADTIKSVLGIKPEPYEIPFIPNREEFARLRELFALKVTSREEARSFLRRELEQMMRNRPGLIGLEATGSAPSFFAETAEKLGGTGVDPINTDTLRDLHELMGTGPEMRELQIFPGFTKAVEESVERDLS